MPTLTAKLTATALAAHGLYKKGKSIYQTFKRKDISDILSRDDGYWRDNSKTKTNIPDGIGNDLRGQTFQPKVDKTNTEVGDGTAGTAVKGQSDVGDGIGALPVSALKTGAISQAAVKSKKIPFKSFRLKGGLPTTPHNVGRRVNPQ